MENQTFEKLFIQIKPDFEFLLARMRAALEVEEVTFADITATNMIKFKDYMEGEVADSTLKTYFANVKSVINTLSKDGLVSSRCCDVLKVKAAPSENVFCTEEELARMDAYLDELVRTNASEGKIGCLALFLLENVTGARTSDCIRLTAENIKDGKLVYISQKTKQKSVMPVHRNLLKYLRYKPNREYSIMHRNRVIKEAGKKCGITQVIKLFYRGKWREWPKYMYLGTHTGRRDFATHLDRHGAPLTEICQFMNHKQNVSQTMRYIIPDYENVSREAMSFFG